MANKLPIFNADAHFFIDDKERKGCTIFSGIAEDIIKMGDKIKVNYDEINKEVGKCTFEVKGIERYAIGGDIVRGQTKKGERTGILVKFIELKGDWKWKEL